LALSDLRDGLRVLDVGCGIGGTVAVLGDSYDRMELTGLNIDGAQLEVARASVRQHPGNRYDWVEADACALPFADASVDRVLAIECIFHFGSRRRFFAEAARVVCPGGRLVFSDFVASPALRAVRGNLQPAFAIEKSICTGVGPWPDFWGDDSDNVAIAREAGFSLIETENASRATQPSYRCFLASEPITDPRDATNPDPIDRARALMEWLQAKGLIDMVFFAFAR
jgi:ubiquinone/menaquinone biosynthesis C-methylase UbiE